MARARASLAPAAATGSELPRRLRTFVTPEGTPLTVQLGEAGERLGAFLLDLLFQGLITVGFALLMILLVYAVVSLTGFKNGALTSVEVQAGVALWFVGQFAVRNAYFIAFELSPRAATPGKRICGLRVASRDGGRLGANAVIARNLMREVETFMPLAVASAGGKVGGEWAILAALGWAGVLAFFPLFNRDRLRVGDLVAGTWVVKAPRRQLQPDLADETLVRRDRFAFTLAEADAYGVKELYVLEAVLRRADRKVIAEVAARIRAKLGREPDPDASDGDFLTAYYAALRSRLEAGLKLGRRRKDKFDRA